MTTIVWGHRTRSRGEEKTSFRPERALRRYRCVEREPGPRRRNHRRDPQLRGVLRSGEAGPGRHLSRGPGLAGGEAEQGFEDFAAGSGVPTDADIAGANHTDRAMVKAADEDVDIPDVLAGFVTLIGDRNGVELIDWAARQPDCPYGTLEHALTAFSDKEVRFV